MEGVHTVIVRILLSFLYEPPLLHGGLGSIVLFHMEISWTVKVHYTPNNAELGYTFRAVEDCFLLVRNRSPKPYFREP